MSILVVNYWGGIPNVLMGNMRPGGEWARDCSGGVLGGLMDGFRDLIRVTDQHTLFHLAKSHGFQTVLLGPTGLRGAAAPAQRFLEDELPDPTESLKELGVDICSVHDEGSLLPGRASVHDASTLRQALDVLQTAGQSAKLFLWVNLLGCRDVGRIRFRPTAGTPSVDVCSGRKTPKFDPRLLPRSLKHRVEEVTALCLEEERLEFSEPSLTPLRDGGEYATLMFRALATLQELQPPVDRLIQVVLERGGELAVTCTRSMLLGEHGMRTFVAPLKACTDTLWACTTDKTAGLRSLHTKMNVFLSHALGRRPAFSSSETLSHCVLGGQVLFLRFECRVRQRSYSCVYRGQEEHLLLVFDLDADPEETQNIMEHTGHLHALFYEAKQRLLQQTPFPLPRSAPLPPPPPPPPPDGPPRPSAASVLHHAPATPKPAERTPKPLSVRGRETRLNRNHR